MQGSPIERSDHIFSDDPISLDTVDTLVGRDLIVKERVEAAAGRKPKPFPKQRHALSIRSQRKLRSRVDPELREAAPLLLILNKASAQLGVQRVDCLK